MLYQFFSGIVNNPDYLKWISLNNQQFKSQPTLINLYSNEYIEGLCYYPFAVNLYKCTGSCNTLNDLSNRVYISNKTKNLHLNVFNMITVINESQILAKHISCKRKSKFDGRKCNSN